MEIMDVLSRLSVINRDNGKMFTQTSRLDAITSLLWNSCYRRINSDGLFNLYSKSTIEQLQEQSIIVVSTHVDCESGISRCFTSFKDCETMCGTYDNAITNAAIVKAMLSTDLPENVIVAFTGDEEENSKGAKHLLKFLQSKGIGVEAFIVLDVTDMGWTEKADFTIENNFWSENIGRRVIEIANNFNCIWRFVPSNIDDIPSYIKSENIIYEEAEEDESWYYDEENQNCFSFCLPVSGNMHSDTGVLILKKSFFKYCDMLEFLLKNI